MYVCVGAFFIVSNGRLNPMQKNLLQRDLLAGSREKINLSYTDGKVEYTQAMTERERKSLFDCIWKDMGGRRQTMHLIGDK
jgi:hypothetical protein